MHEIGESLIHAVRTGDLETMRSVLGRNAELVNSTADMSIACSPATCQAIRLIHLAVAEEQMEAARVLIEHGALLNRPSYDVSAWGPAAHVANTTLAPRSAGTWGRSELPERSKHPMNTTGVAERKPG